MSTTPLNNNIRHIFFSQDYFAGKTVGHYGLLRYLISAELLGSKVKCYWPKPYEKISERFITTICTVLSLRTEVGLHEDVLLLLCALCWQMDWYVLQEKIQPLTSCLFCLCSYAITSWDPNVKSHSKTDVCDFSTRKHNVIHHISLHTGKKQHLDEMCALDFRLVVVLVCGETVC